MQLPLGKLVVGMISPVFLMILSDTHQTIYTDEYDRWLMIIVSHSEYRCLYFFLNIDDYPLVNGDDPLVKTKIAMENGP